MSNSETAGEHRERVMNSTAITVRGAEELIKRLQQGEVEEVIFCLEEAVDEAFRVAK